MSFGQKVLKSSPPQRTAASFGPQCSRGSALIPPLAAILNPNSVHKNAKKTEAKGSCLLQHNLKILKMSQSQLRKSAFFQLEQPAFLCMSGFSKCEPQQHPPTSLKYKTVLAKLTFSPWSKIPSKNVTLWRSVGGLTLRNGREGVSGC